MTSTADLPRVALPADDGGRSPRWPRATAWCRDAVETRSDLMRLAATLSGVATVVAGVGLLTADAEGAHLRTALRTPYGLVALGKVQPVGPAEHGPVGGDAAAHEAHLLVPVTLHNLSDEVVHYGAEHFRLLDDETVVLPESRSVPTGEVAPGGAVQLRLVFHAELSPGARLVVDEAEDSLLITLPAVGSALPSV